MTSQRSSANVKSLDSGVLVEFPTPHLSEFGARGMLNNASALVSLTYSGLESTKCNSIDPKTGVLMAFHKAPTEFTGRAYASPDLKGDKVSFVLLHKSDPEGNTQYHQMHIQYSKKVPAEIVIASRLLKGVLSYFEKPTKSS